jgi:hypothetical protein
MQSRMLCLMSGCSFALLGALAAGACGGSQSAAEAPAEPIATVSPPVPAPEPASEAPPAEAPADAAAPGPAKVKFDDLSEDQQKQYMKDVVLPQMKETFLSLNAKRYANMNCVTCHGESAKKGEFEMPNPKLPKLDPTDNFKAHMKHDAEVVKFMAERVVPEMAKLLDEEPYDPTTERGFGCFECHVKK